MSFGGLASDSDASTTDYVFRADVVDADDCEGGGIGFDRYMYRVDDDPEVRTGTVSAECPAGAYTLRVSISSADDTELASATAGFFILGAPVLIEPPTLTALSVSHGDPAVDVTLSPAFESGTLAYRAAVRVAQVTVAPTASDADATVAYLDGNGDAIADADAGADGHQVDLGAGSNTVKVAVSKGGLTTTYAVALFRLVTQQQTSDVTLVSNQGRISTAGHRLRNSGEKVAQAFTTGSNEGGYNLASVTLLMSGHTASSDVTVTIREVSSSNPSDSVLHTLGYPATVPSGHGLNTFTAPANTVLAKDTTYFVHIESGGTPTIIITVTSDDGEDSGAATGWSIADKFRDYGTSWTEDAGRALKIQVTGSVATAPNNAPVFPSGTITRSVEENTRSGQNVGAPVAATDTDGDTLTYSLEGTDGGSFTIVSTSGQIQTSAWLNYEDKSSYSVTVKVNDGTVDATTSVTISVTDVVEPPGVPAAPTVSAKAGTTDSLDVSWGAPANTGPAIDDYNVQYRMGTTGSFTSHPFTGTGRATTITGLNASTSYQVQVQAHNDEGDSLWSASATGNTNAPGNAAPTFPSGTITRSVEENTRSGQNVGAPVAATDTDGDTLTYSLEGTDGGSFTIVSTSGQIQTSAALNYEAKSTYSVTVKVNDGTVNVTKAVTISVTDVAEPPDQPAAPTVSARAGTTDSLNVSWTAPANTGRPAIDDYNVRYRIGTTGSFTSHSFSGTGRFTTIAGLNADTTYEVQVQAHNPEGDSAWSASATASTNAATSAVSSDATLSNLTLSGVNFGAFDPATTGYTASVANDVNETTVTPTTNDGGATYEIKLGGVADGDGTVELSVGSNVITVEVTAEDGVTTETYTVTVTRAPAGASSDATLSELTLSGITFTPAFAPETTSYRAILGNSVSTTVTAVTTDDKATREILTRGVRDADVDLAVGYNVITVVVTAEDGVTTKTYTVAVTVARAESADGPHIVVAASNGVFDRPGGYRERDLIIALYNLESDATWSGDNYSGDFSTLDYVHRTDILDAGGSTDMADLERRNECEGPALFERNHIQMSVDREIRKVNENPETRGGGVIDTGDCANDFAVTVTVWEGAAYESQGRGAVPVAQLTCRFDGSANDDFRALPWDGEHEGPGWYYHEYVLCTDEDGDLAPDSTPTIPALNWEPPEYD